MNAFLSQTEREERNVLVSISRMSDSIAPVILDQQHAASDLAFLGSLLVGGIETNNQK